MVTKISGVDESTTGRHILALDGVRGLAIVSVLAFHLFVRNPRPEGSLLVRAVTTVMACGWVGVDLFFALSGFLITGILYDTRATPNFFKNFYARRVLRIFPLYYGFFVLVVCISALQGYQWNKAFFPVYLLYVENLFPIWYTTAPWVNLNHLWSLCIEEQFYLMWPALVFLLRTKRRIAAVAVSGALASLGFRIYAGSSGLIAVDHYIQYSFTPSRMDGLLLGALLAVVVRSHYRDVVLRWASPVLVVLLVFWAAVLVSMKGPLPVIGNAFVGTFGTSMLAITATCLVASVLRSGSVASAVLSTPALRFFGRYSYGLYVFHYAFHGLLDEPLWHLLAGHTQLKSVQIFVSGSIQLLLSIVAALVSFQFFELPILRLKSRFMAHGGAPKLHRVMGEASKA